MPGHRQPGKTPMTQSTGDAAVPVVNGSVLEGPYWSEPVRALSAQMRGRRVEIHAVGLESDRGRHGFAGWHGLGRDVSTVRKRMNRTRINTDLH